jgi:hypothetical protein
MVIRTEAEMLLKAVAFAFLALIIAAPASAGTMTYKYGVERFEPAGDLRASARLRPILHQPSGASPCALLEMQIQFRPEPFWRRTWSRDVKAADHRQAVATIEARFQKKGALEVGVFDTLRPNARGTCRIAVRGIRVTPEGWILAFTKPI